MHEVTKMMSSKFDATTLKITTFSITTLCINDTQLKLPFCWMLRLIHCYAECLYAVCRGAQFLAYIVNFNKWNPNLIIPYFPF